MKNRILLLMAFFIATQFANAQTPDARFAIGVGLIRNEYNGDYGSGIWNFNETWYAAGGLSLGYYLTPSFDLGLQGSYGQYGFREYNSFPQANNFRGLKTDASLFTHYKLNNGYLLSKDSKLSPFISLGLGLATYGIDPAYDKSGTNPKDFPTIITKGTDFTGFVGAGLKYQLSEHFAIQYQYLYFDTDADNHDENRGLNYFGNGHPHPAHLTNDCYGQHILSFVFNFGKPRDTDKDGVADKYDKCPDTPLGVKVDANGCPIDSDGDGVPDYLDKCPNTPAGVKVDAKGCPLDTDGDGVPDYLDKCPDTPQGVTVDANGCPLDADGDGVPDYLDKCPNTPAGVAVDTKGCPVDADGDGVPDYLDKCPDTPAGVAVDANGCPITPVVPPVINSQFKNTLFQLGKSIVRKPYYININEVAKFMKENPTYTIELKGYADITGSDGWNIILSQNRANAVKKYLERKGVESSRITTVGYGKKFPIADNATFVGRMKNRRVEFVIK
jgi:outer membrane protein OmpA-like peptidoglycan-associated protein/opacity protein-like surface antigen